MRLGLIGLGRIGAFHAGTLASIPAIESLVVTDLKPERTKQVVDRHGVEGVDSPDALFAAGVDGVIIAASTDAHTHLVLSCVQAGLPALCEKPVAPDGAAGAESGARAAVESGELGWINTVRSTTLDPEPPTPEYVAVSGGMFRDCGIHDFDIIRWITGHEAVEVYAAGSNRGADFFRRYDDVDIDTKWPIRSTEPAANADEAADVRDAAHQAGVIVADGFHYLYHPVTWRLQDLLASGELGELTRVETTVVMLDPGADDPRWSYALAGGAMMDLGCYALHAQRALARWAGGEPSVVAAKAGERADAAGVDEWLDADLVFAGGATGSARCHMAADRWQMTCRVIGDRGEATVANFVQPHLDCSILPRSRQCSTRRCRVRISTRSGLSWRCR